MDTSTTAFVTTTVASSPKSHYQDILIGCVLAICGNLLISVSLNVQKYTHLRNEEREVSIHYTRNPLWWVGVSLMVIGEVGNFSAYGYAPASLVAPLGTTTVIANMFIAAAILKEKIKPEHLFGSALAVVGAILLVAFSSKKERMISGDVLTDYLTQVSFIVYICIELAFLTALFIMMYVYKMQRVVIYLLITSIIASFSVISAKAVSSMIQLTFDGTSQLTYPSLYIMCFVMVATAVMQVKYLNTAMKNFDATIVVPTNFVFFTISAIIAGIVFYKEFYGMTALQIFMFLFGCIMSFVGVYFIVAGRGSVEAIVKANKEPEKDKAPLLTTNIFPCKKCCSLHLYIYTWLLATVNVGQVQPSGSINHFNEDEASYRRPFISQDHGDSSSEDTLYSAADSVTSPLHQPAYGSQE